MLKNYVIQTFLVWSPFADQSAVAAINRALRLERDYLAFHLLIYVIGSCGGGFASTRSSIYMLSRPPINKSL
jgi:hypothetical protein